MTSSMRAFNFRLAVIAILALTLSRAGAQDVDSGPTPKWPNDYLARVQLLALIQSLDVDLLSHDSATLTLERWCAAHRLAIPATVTALRVTGVDKAPSLEQREELRVTASETIGYRRVKLSCGPIVLSEADNWYVPNRLTPDMNRVLETTDTPFGKVVRPLQFHRHTLSSTLLWSPLPEHWEMNTAPKRSHKGDMQIPDSLLQNTALLTLPDGTPISEVIETYKRSLLAFPAPH